MIAAQLVLGLVEPQSSGIGGGAFAVYWDNERRTLASYDGRETAPAAAGPDLFLGPDGKPLKFWDAVVGGRSVGTPGLVRMLELAHKNHGKLEWARPVRAGDRAGRTGLRGLAAPATRWSARTRFLKTLPQAAAYFYDGNGDPGRSDTFCATRPMPTCCASIAAEGADAFYTGPIARAIVKAVRDVPRNPGLLNLTDLASYEAKRRPPVCGTYRKHAVCGMGPPSSGGLTVAMILGQLDRFDLAKLGPDSSRAWHLFAGIRAAGLCGPRPLHGRFRFRVQVPAAGLIDAGYLKKRARLIGTDRSMGKATAGEPPDRRAGRWRPTMPWNCRRRRTSRWSIPSAMPVADHLDRERLRQPGHGQRLFVEQPAHRFFLPGRTRRRAGGQPGPGRQAPALVDGADHRVPARRFACAPWSVRRAAAGSSTMSPRRSSP